MCEYYLYKWQDAYRDDPAHDTQIWVTANEMWNEAFKLTIPSLLNVNG